MKTICKGISFEDKGNEIEMVVDFKSVNNIDKVKKTFRKWLMDTEIEKGEANFGNALIFPDRPRSNMVRFMMIQDNHMTNEKFFHSIHDQFEGLCATLNDDRLAYEVKNSFFPYKPASTKTLYDESIKAPIHCHFKSFDDKQVFKNIFYKMIDELKQI